MTIPAKLLIGTVRAAALSCSLGLSAVAQAPIPRAGDPSLAAALAAAQPPTEGVALAVDAAKVGLPEGSVLPGVRPSVTGVADEYNRLARPFGAVTAVAPPTMVVLGTPPGNPDPYDGMPPGDTVKLLAATLTPDQWKALLSEHGLGLSDLVDAKQRDLFLTLFPGGALRVQWDRPNEPNRDEDIQDLSAEIPQARLRLGQRVNLGLPVTGHPEIHTFGMSFDPAGAPKRYVQVGGAEVDADFVDGARVRAELPNEPKPGGLDLDAPALQTPVPLAGVKTVGQLVLRIGGLCHTEIYADARVEGKGLTLAGAPVAPAADLLRAVAFCVTGAYRKVGPAYVLTDDVLGVGVRRQLWADFERRAAALRRDALDEAGDAVTAAHTLDDVSAQGDPLGFPPEEVAAFHKQHAADLANHIQPSGDMMGVTLPLDKLTPAQQEVARHTAEFYEREPEGERPTVEGQIMVQSEVTLQVMLPSLDGPVDMQYSLMGLFTPSEATIDKQITQADTRGRKFQAEWDARRAQSEALPLAGLLQGPAHRAVLAGPRTAAEADALVASAKALGLDEIWLDVFSGGTAHTEALTEALKDTAGGGGIRVFAALDLLRWGPDAPPEAADLTLQGDTSAADADRRDRENEAEMVRRGWTTGTRPARPARPMTVSPFSPLVRQRLTDLVRDLAGRPGLAGLVWRDTAAPGYLVESGHMITIDAPSPLGYAEAGRLAFLRRAHSDPVDLFPNEYRQGHADTRLPVFDDSELDRSLWKRWGQFRASANLDLLHTLYSAVTLGQTVLIGARGPADRDTEQGAPWYGTWDGVARPPTDRDQFEGGESWQDEPTQARAQSGLIWYPVPVPPGGQAVPEQYRSAMLAGLKQQLHEAFGAGLKKPWDGYVLDATVPPTARRPGALSVADPLALLSDTALKTDDPSKP